MCASEAQSFLEHSYLQAQAYVGEVKFCGRRSKFSLQRGGSKKLSRERIKLLFQGGVKVGNAAENGAKRK